MNSTHADYSPTVDTGNPAKILALLQAAKGLEERVERVLGEVQLSIAKFGVLSHLVDAVEAIPLSELASRVNCVRSNVTQMVDRLEAEGLVRRMANPADRRIILAELTDLGRRRQTAGAERMQGLERTMAETVEPEDWAAIRRAMQAL